MQHHPGVIRFERPVARMLATLLPPANEVCEGYVFTGVCLSTGGRSGVCGCQGACMVAGGCVWLQEGVHGCGVCVVGRGVHGCWGACMVAGGDMHGFQGVCVVVGGGLHGCQWGGACVAARGACVVVGGGACIGYDEIRSMSGRYASYWNAFFL